MGLLPKEKLPANFSLRDLYHTEEPSKKIMALPLSIHFFYQIFKNMASRSSYVFINV